MCSFNVCVDLYYRHCCFCNFAVIALWDKLDKSYFKCNIAFEVLMRLVLVAINKDKQSCKVTQSLFKQICWNCLRPYFPSWRIGYNDDDDDDDVFFSIRFKSGVTWSRRTSRRSASRGDLPRWNKVGKC